LYYQQSNSAKNGGGSPSESVFLLNCDLSMDACKMANASAVVMTSNYPKTNFRMLEHHTLYCTLPCRVHLGFDSKTGFEFAWWRRIKNHYSGFK